MRRDRSAGDAEAPRRRIEEPELGNAVMREVAEAFASSKGRYGYRRVRAAFRTRVSGKAPRRIMAEDGPTAYVPERRGYGSYEGEATPAPGDLADRDFTAGMPNGKWLTDITRDQGRGREGRASRRRSTATTAESSHARPVPVPTRKLADRMLVKAAETLPGGARPLVRSDRGCHCRWPGWLALMDRYGPARSTGAKGRSPDDAAAEGFLGRMRTESVYPGHWEERTRDGVLVLIDDCIRWYDHERIKRPLGWMSPVQIPSKPGNGCVTISKKTSATPYLVEPTRIGSPRRSLLTDCIHLGARGERKLSACRKRSPTLLKHGDRTRQRTLTTNDVIGYPRKNTADAHDSGVLCVIL